MKLIIMLISKGVKIMKGGTEKMTKEKTFEEVCKYREHVFTVEKVFKPQSQKGILLLRLQGGKPDVCQKCKIKRRMCKRKTNRKEVFS